MQLDTEALIPAQRSGCSLYSVHHGPFWYFSNWPHLCRPVTADPLCPLGPQSSTSPTLTLWVLMVPGLSHGENEKGHLENRECRVRDPHYQRACQGLCSVVLLQLGTWYLDPWFLWMCVPGFFAARVLKKAVNHDCISSLDMLCADAFDLHRTSYFCSITFADC